MSSRGKTRLKKQSAFGIKAGPAQGGTEANLNLRKKSPDQTNSASMFLLCFLLFGTVVWTFWPSLQCQFLFFDEYGYLWTNPHVNSGLTLSGCLWALHSLDYSNWYPLTWLSHMLDFQIYGKNPWGHHLTNVLFHAANSILLFLVMRLMTGARWRSFILALLFALHPLRVESVTWISERKDVLSLFFWMLTLWAYWRFAQVQSGGKRRFFYGLCLSFFALGLMSKTMLVTLPCVLLLLDYWPLERWTATSLSSLFLEKLPFFGLTIFVSVVSYIAQQRGGMLLQMTRFPLTARLENTVVSYGRYLGKFFCPTRLCVFYPHPGHWPIVIVIVSALLVSTVSVLVWQMRSRKPYLLVGWFWFLGTLLPVIGIIQLGSQAMADRYTYIPMIGIAWLVVWGLSDLLRTWPYKTFIGLVMATAALVICAKVTRYQISYWKDDPTLWQHAIAVTDNNSVAYTCLGVVFWPFDVDRAFAAFQNAVLTDPKNTDAQEYLAQELVKRNRFDDAIVHYNAVLGIKPDQPEALFGLGQSFWGKGQFDESVYWLQKSVALDPNNANHLCSLGEELITKGQPDEARPLFLKVLAIDPDNELAHFHLAMLLIKGNEVEQSRPHISTVVRLAPENETQLSALGVALLAKPHLNDALPLLERAIKLNPDRPESLGGLGFCLMKLGRVDDAVPYLQKAIETNPENPEHHSNLGYAFWKENRLDDAIAEYRTVLKIKPDFAEAANNLKLLLKLEEDSKSKK